MECCAEEGGKGQANNFDGDGALSWPGGVKRRLGHISSNAEIEDTVWRPSGLYLRAFDGKVLSQKEVALN